MDSKNESLRDLFLHELQGIYYMEKNLVDALDEMASHIKSGTLSEAFMDHMEETEGQVERLEAVFAAIGNDPVEREHPVFEGIMREHNTLMEQFQTNDLQDVFHLGLGIKIEQNEMIVYDNLLMLADRMELGNNVIDPLKENRGEEENTLKDLRRMAKGSKIKSLMDRLMP